MIFAHLCH